MALLHGGGLEYGDQPFGQVMGLLRIRTTLWCSFYHISDPHVLVLHLSGWCRVAVTALPYANDRSPKPKALSSQ